MIFYYFKHFLMLFNVNEHLAVSFAELTRGAFGVGHLHFFCLHKITCLNIPTVTQT